MRAALRSVEASALWWKRSLTNSAKKWFDASDERALEAVGAAFAADSLGQGDIVLLKGRVGVGKSVFARGCVRSLMKDRELVVPSPTYLLEQEYGPVHGAQFMVRHFDLYRIQDRFTETDWDALDWSNVLLRDICLIEWPECVEKQILQYCRTSTLNGGVVWEVQIEFKEGQNDGRDIHIRVSDCHKS